MLSPCCGWRFLCRSRELATRAPGSRSGGLPLGGDDGEGMWPLRGLGTEIQRWEVWRGVTVPWSSLTPALDRQLLPDTATPNHPP